MKGPAPETKTNPLVSRVPETNELRPAAVSMEFLVVVCPERRPEVTSADKRITVINNEEGTVVM